MTPYEILKTTRPHPPKISLAYFVQCHHNSKVAAYWREHFDLTHIVARDWATLGPKLKGKLHIYVGYGERAEHCWNGDPTLPNAYSRLHYNFMYLPKILARIAATAPAGADLASWRY